MRKIITLRSTVAAVAVLAAFASTASATTITITNPGAGYRQGSGGEFQVKGVDASGQALLAPYLPFYVAGLTRFGDAFETFCVETDEYFTWGGVYDASIVPGASGGGAGGPSPDPISRGTAYLYSRFATGVLTGYAYTPGAARAASAGQLQEAIWYLEDELSLGTPLANPFLSQVSLAFGSLATSKLDQLSPTVMALSLGTTHQDQLILTSVPDGGATVMLMGLALSGLALLRRQSA
jgi:hypothetical protein